MIRILDNLKCSACQWAVHMEGVGWRCSMPLYYECSNREVER